MTGTDAGPRDPNSHEIEVWEFPVRLFHAALILLLPALWWTAEEGKFTWHMILGTGTLALLVFRVAWGFVGGRTARFSTFLRGPRAVFNYVQAKFADNSSPVIGHNPLGGWSVLSVVKTFGANCGVK